MICLEAILGHEMAPVVNYHYAVDGALRLVTLIF